MLLMYTDPLLASGRKTLKAFHVFLNTKNPNKKEKARKKCEELLNNFEKLAENTDGHMKDLANAFMSEIKICL